MVIQTKTTQDKAWLEQGEKFEKQLIEFLRKKDPDTFKRDGAFSEFDVVMPNKGSKGITLECKNQEKSIINFYIQIITREGYPSGLAKTTADLWVIQDNNKTLYVTTPKMIKEYIFDDDLPLCTTEAIFDMYKASPHFALVEGVSGTTGYSIPRDAMPVILKREKWQDQ